MKKFIAFAAAVLVSLSAFAQGPVTKYMEGRFGNDDGTSPVFISKGRHALGIKVGFRSMNAAGDDLTNAGYSLLSLLNIGKGQLKIWDVSPRFSTFIANDLSLGVELNYNGYAVDTDLRLDFRDIINSENEIFNVTVSNRSMVHHAGGASLVLRRYVPVLGSKYVAVFAEGRLQGSYGATTSAPRDLKDFNRERLSQSFSVGLKAGGGLAFKLKNNALTLSVPLIGIVYNHTKQNKTTTSIEVNETTGETTEKQVNSTSHMSGFNIARNVDLLGLQVGFVRYL